MIGNRTHAISPSLKKNILMRKYQRIQNEITNNFPDFEIQKIKRLGEGWMNEAFLINGQWVFRFPKSRHADEDLEKEINILPVLAKRLTLSIPQFQYIGKQSNGYPFVGYKILPGDVIGEDVIPTLSKEVQESIAKQLAMFIDELSSFPVDEAEHLSVPEYDNQIDYAETFEEVQQLVFPHIDDELKEYITSRFDAYLNDPKNFQYDPTLIHADLSPNHMIIKPKTFEITGIIDFGDIHIGDPDYEYLYILEDCGRDFTKHIMALRNQDDIDARLEKVSIFVTIDYVGTILEGMKRGEQEWVNIGINALRKEMKQ